MLPSLTWLTELCYLTCKFRVLVLCSHSTISFLQFADVFSQMFLIRALKTSHCILLVVFVVLSRVFLSWKVITCQWCVHNSFPTKVTGHKVISVLIFLILFIPSEAIDFTTQGCRFTCSWLVPINNLKFQSSLLIFLTNLSSVLNISALRPLQPI